MPRPDEAAVRVSTCAAAPPAKAAHAKELPSVDRLLCGAAACESLSNHGQTLVTAEARALLEELRVRARAGALTRAELEPAALDAALQARVRNRLAPRMR